MYTVFVFVWLIFRRLYFVSGPISLIVAVNMYSTINVSQVGSKRRSSPIPCRACAEKLLSPTVTALLQFQLLIDSPYSLSFSSLQVHSLFNFHSSVQIPKGEKSLLLCSSRIWVRTDFFSFAEAGSHVISFAHIALFFTHLGPVWNFFFLCRSWFSFYKFCSYCSVLHASGSGLNFFFFCRSWFSLLTNIFYPLLLVYFQICFLFTDLLHSFSWGHSVLSWKEREE